MLDWLARMFGKPTAAPNASQPQPSSAPPADKVDHGPSDLRPPAPLSSSGGGGAASQYGAGASGGGGAASQYGAGASGGGGAAAKEVMLILPGIAHVGTLRDAHGLLDRPSAIEYAKRRGYVGRLLNVSGEAYANSPQARAATEAVRTDPTITALYGFSGGGYNLRHVLEALTHDELARIKLVVVLGAPDNPPSDYAGTWELVYKKDPPTGHMDGPRALLAATPAPSTAA